MSAPHDKIVSVLLVFFAAISSTDPATLSELTHKLDSHGRSEFLETLTDLLGSALTEREKDGLALVSAGLGDVELKKAGIARAEKGLVRCIHYVKKMSKVDVQICLIALVAWQYYLQQVEHFH